jgi:hypothetical protein
MDADVALIIEAIKDTSFRAQVDAGYLREKL